jgi:hypothetical protein
MRNLFDRRGGRMLLRKARVRCGDYGRFTIPREHDGAEIWIVAEPPRRMLFRNPQGMVAEGLVYQRADGLVAGAEYLELTPEFCLVETAGNRPLH